DNVFVSTGVRIFADDPTTIIISLGRFGASEIMIVVGSSAAMRTPVETMTLSRLWMYPPVNIGSTGALKRRITSAGETLTVALSGGLMLIQAKSAARAGVTGTPRSMQPSVTTSIENNQRARIISPAPCRNRCMIRRSVYERWDLHGCAHKA